MERLQGQNFGERELANKLVISTIGQQKSILLSSVISTPQRNITVQYVSLVDSGCTGEAFLDENLAIQNWLPVYELWPWKPLLLANGGLKSWIKYFMVFDLQIGHYGEWVHCYVTNLAAEHPVILSIPWLRKHNPVIDWPTLNLKFNHCGDRCLP
jgi:hypothetical protein